MIPSIGHAAVLVGLGLTAYAAVAYFLVARGGDPRLAISARRAVIGSFLAAAVGCAAMIVSLLTHDFSVRYVAENNATTTPPFISVISLWAALEGSILFWALLATGWATLVLHRYRERHRHLMPWVGAVLATVNAFFFAVMTWPGNPFALTSPAGTEGAGPNALLQNHPFMALHPPLLYLGYTGMAIPFAFGIAALATRRLDEEWLRIVRRWTLIPWTFLTLGIVAGAWWSYEVLGWGGYWAWDPVENAALLPWLTATAFVHSAMVAERRGGLRIWTSALVIATFVLTLVGTFLTRSGVVASVHSFTQSAIGPWFLAGILVALAGSTDDHVPESVVTVDDARPPLRRDTRRETPVDLREHRQLPRLGLLELGVPALQLTFDVPLFAGQGAEADTIGVDGVQPAEDVDQVLGDGSPRRRRIGLGVGDRGQHDAGHEGHHVERRADHRDVVAVAEGLGDRDVGRRQGGDDAVLATHVVGGVQHVAERGTAQHELAPNGIDHPVGQVGATAGDELERQRGDDIGDVLDDPLGGPTDVDAQVVAHRHPSWIRPGISEIQPGT